MEKIKSIGIMGGTFDPIHYGHLMVASCAVEAFGLEKVFFVPSRIPPHKMNQQITSPEMRYEMTLLATMDNPWFSVSRVELERNGMSYTVDTIKYFQSEFPDYRIYFITGADTIVEIVSWKAPEELFAMTYFITAARPGYSFSGLQNEFYQRYKDKIAILEVPELAISSTGIRRRVKMGKSIKYYLHPLVEAYISKHQLYR